MAGFGWEVVSPAIGCATTTASAAATDCADVNGRAIQPNSSGYRTSTTSTTMGRSSAVASDRFSAARTTDRVGSAPKRCSSAAARRDAGAGTIRSVVS